MKKFLLANILFLVGIFSINQAVAGECKRNTGGKHNTNDYLFISRTDYNGNRAFECDDTECPDGTKVIVGKQGAAIGSATGSAIRFGTPIIATCTIEGSGDFWSFDNFSDLKKCSDSDPKNFLVTIDGCHVYSSEAKWNSMDAGGWAMSTHGDFCCGEEPNKPTPPNPTDEKQCEGYLPDKKPLVLKIGETYDLSLTETQCKSLPLINTPDSNGIFFKAYCTDVEKFKCCPIECQVGKPDIYTCSCKKDQPGPGPQKSCTEKRTGKPVGVACCNLEDAGLATYEAKNDVCTCKDASRTFKIDQSNGRGMCVNNTPIDPDCDTNTGAVLDKATHKCKCPSGMTLNGDNVSCSCVDPNKKYDSIKKQCEYTEEYLLIVKIKEIREIRARLNGIISGLGLSVWKDEEGNFNKARFASDAVALVVLGTVGGAVTSTLVKKNQIKKGFEAIQCSIGGYIVANYGDEFVVGPAR